MKRIKEIKEILLLSAFVISALIVLSFAIIKQSDNEEEFSCQLAKKVYVKGFKKEMRKQMIRETVSSFSSSSADFDKALSALEEGQIDKSITLFEKLATQDDAYAVETAGSFLTMLYAHKNNYEKTLYWYHQLALMPSTPSAQYGLALGYFKICEEEVQEAEAEIVAKLQLVLKIIKFSFPKLNVQAYIDFLQDPDLLPKDYIQAYFWADLAVKNQFPTAVELRDLIAEKLTAEEVEQALNFSY